MQAGDGSAGSGALGLASARRGGASIVLWLCTGFFLFRCGRSSARRRARNALTHMPRPSLGHPCLRSPTAPAVARAARRAATPTNRGWQWYFVHRDPPSLAWPRPNAAHSHLQLHTCVAPESAERSNKPQLQAPALRQACQTALVIGSLLPFRQGRMTLASRWPRADSAHSHYRVCVCVTGQPGRKRLELPLVYPYSQQQLPRWEGEEASWTTSRFRLSWWDRDGDLWDLARLEWTPDKRWGPSAGSETTRLVRSQLPSI